jgi:hypothetical protein
MDLRRLFPVATALSGLLFVLSTLPSYAFQAPPAGGYKVEDAKEPKKDDLRIFTSALRSGQFSQEEQPIIESVTKYSIAEFTLPHNLSVLPKKRAELKTRLKIASNAELPDAHKYLRVAVRTGMMRLCGPEYHPFVRVNAMLVLAELNEKEATTDNKEPPKGDVETLKFMIKAADDPKQLEAVKAAAMMGIDRQARLLAEAAKRPDGPVLKDDRLANDTLKLAIEMVKPSHHEWLRRRGVALIAALGLVGKEAESPKLLQQLMANPKESLTMRCAAARAFGSLDFTSGPRIPFNTAILQMAHLSFEVLDKTKPKTGWIPEEMYNTEAHLRDLEVGLRGRPDPTPSFQERPPDRGMTLVLTGQEDPQRKLLDETLGKLAPIAKLVYSGAAGRAQELETAVGALETWVQAHPLEAKPDADKTADAPKKSDASSVAKP